MPSFGCQARAYESGSTVNWLHEKSHNSGIAAKRHTLNGILDRLFMADGSFGYAITSHQGIIYKYVYMTKKQHVSLYLSTIYNTYCTYVTYVQIQYFTVEIASMYSMYCTRSLTQSLLIKVPNFER